MPGLDDVLAAHLAHLRLLGRSERTVYDRERAVIRLAAWLGAQSLTASEAGPVLSSSAPVKPVKAMIGAIADQQPGAERETADENAHAADATSQLLHATPADLAAWRASLTVGDQAVVVY